MEGVVEWSLERVGSGTPLVYTLPRDRDMVSIGRQSSDIICQGKTVSRFHSQLIFKDDAWHVVDLRSTNKVFINKRSINPNEPVKLSEGDFVGIGAMEPTQPDFFIFKFCKNIRNINTSQGIATPSSPLACGPPSPNIGNVADQLLSSSPIRPNIEEAARKEIQPLNRTAAPSLELAENLNALPNSTSEKTPLTESGVVSSHPDMSTHQPHSARDQQRPESSQSSGAVGNSASPSVLKKPRQPDHCETHSSDVGKQSLSNNASKLSVVKKSAKQVSQSSSSKESKKTSKDTDRLSSVSKHSSSSPSVPSSSALSKEKGKSASAKSADHSKSSSSQAKDSQASRSNSGQPMSASKHKKVSKTTSSSQEEIWMKKFKIKQCSVVVLNIDKYLRNRKSINLKKTPIPTTAKKISKYKRLIRPTDSDSESESETEVVKPRRFTTRPAVLNSDDDSDEDKQDQSSNNSSGAGNRGNNFVPLIVPKCEKPDDGPSKDKGKSWKPTNTSQTNSTGRRSLTPEQVVSIIMEEDNELIDIVKNEPDDGSEQIPTNWMDGDNEEKSDEETEQDVVKPKAIMPAVANRQKSTIQSKGFTVERLVPVPSSAPSESKIGEAVAGPSSANASMRNRQSSIEEPVLPNQSSTTSCTIPYENKGLQDNEEETHVAARPIFPTFKRDEDASNSGYDTDSDIFIISSDDEVSTRSKKWIKSEPVDVRDDSDEDDEIELWIPSLSQETASDMQKSPSPTGEEQAEKLSDRATENVLEKPQEKPQEKTVEKTVEKTSESAKGKAIKPSRRVSEDEPPVASEINGRRCSNDSANEVPVQDFWPELSQAFVNEIEGDDADDAQDESASEEESEDEEEMEDEEERGEQEEKEDEEEEVEDRDAKLEHLKKTIKPKEHRVQLIQPLRLDPRARLTNSRFEVTTASSAPEKELLAPSGANRRPTAPAPRQAIFIPAGPGPARRRRANPKKLKSLRDLAKKAGGIEGYSASVKLVEKAKKGPVTKSTEEAPTTSTAAPVETAPVEKIAAPLKVKQVKKSRGERLLEELKSTESRKRPLPDNQKPSSYTIPKRKKEDDGPANKRPNTVLTSPPHAAPSSFAAALNRSSAPPAKRPVTGNGLRKPPAPSDRTDSPINGVNNSNDEATVAAQPMEEAGPSGLDNVEPPKRPRKSISFATTDQVRIIERRPSPPPQDNLAIVPYNAGTNATQHPSSRQMESNQAHQRQPHNGGNSHGGYPERSRDPRIQAHSTPSNGMLVPVSNLRPPSSGSSSRDPREPHRSFTSLEAELCSLEVTPETTQVQLNDRFRYQMLMRILKWSPKWILEQQKHNHSTGPTAFLLQQDTECKFLEQLHLQQVATTYRSLKAYYSVFHPLMLLELWETIIKDTENERGTKSWETVMLQEEYPMEGHPHFFIVKCQALCSEQPRIGDLMSIAYAHEKGANSSLFATVEKGTIIKKLSSNPAIDPRLDAKKKQSDKFLITINLRVREMRRPRIADRKFVMHMQKVSSLHTFLRHVQVQASLVMSPLREIVLKPEPSAFQLLTYNRIVGDNLNESQMSALMSITETMIATRSFDPKISLLQGPPGTGKSHVIVQMILRMIRSGQERKWKPRILVCAPSNAAVDEIAVRLIAERNRSTRQSYLIVRIGVHGSMHQAVRPISLDELAHNWLKKEMKKVEEEGDDSNLGCAIRTARDEKKHTADKIKKLQKEIEEQEPLENTADEVARLQRKKAEEEKRLQTIDRDLKAHLYKLHKKMEENLPIYKENLVDKADVIFTTLNSCCNTTMETKFLKKAKDPNSKPFFCCIIDEASQCTEPESLMPLFFRINKVVLVGDPEQLPATVCSNEARSKHFDQSLFNRLYAYLNSESGNGRAVQMLDTQYRMHPEICRWPSKYFYGNKLVTASSVKRDGPLHPYKVFNVTDSKEENYNKEIGNRREMEFVCKLAEAILRCPEMEHKSIGIITFYSKQKSLIENELRQKFKGKKNIVVNTVDGFQGQEKDIIIVSCVRQNVNKNIGFMDTTQRLNVALTRARECLYVCGHLNTLRFSDAWKSLIQDAVARQVVSSVSSLYQVDLLYEILQRPSD